MGAGATFVLVSDGMEIHEAAEFVLECVAECVEDIRKIGKVDD